jgi:hypothetical protein
MKILFWGAALFLLVAIADGFYVISWGYTVTVGKPVPTNITCDPKAAIPWMRCEDPKGRAI